MYYWFKPISCIVIIIFPLIFFILFMLNTILIKMVGLFVETLVSNEI
jgi:hypothetical protein